MTDELEDEFTKIADAAIAATEKVECDFPDFVEGLKIVHENVRDRLRGAREEEKNGGER